MAFTCCRKPPGAVSRPLFVYVLCAACAGLRKAPGKFQNNVLGVSRRLSGSSAVGMGFIGRSIHGPEYIDIENPSKILYYYYCLSTVFKVFEVFHLHYLFFNKLGNR